MIKLKKRQLRKTLLHKAGRIFHRRRRGRIEPVLDWRYEYKTYLCLQVPNAVGSDEVEIMHLTVCHEKDLPCKWMKGQVVEIDRERNE